MEFRVTSTDTERECIFYVSGWIELGAKTYGAAYRELVAAGGIHDTKIGRCVSKMYRTTKHCEAIRIGWVFQKRDKYTDTKEPYIREDWYEVRP